MGITKWLDSDKLRRYGGIPPYTVIEDSSKCELYAQGRDIERNKRLKATRLFEADLVKCKTTQEIIELAKGVCINTYIEAKRSLS